MEPQTSFTFVLRIPRIMTMIKFMGLIQVIWVDSHARVEWSLWYTKTNGSALNYSALELVIYNTKGGVIFAEVQEST